VDAYAEWLKTSSVPKLFLKAEPGGILAGARVLVHFVQEDSPDEIGQAVAGWMKTLG
jgi:haloalkane dehalogenase